MATPSRSSITTRAAGVAVGVLLAVASGGLASIDDNTRSSEAQPATTTTRVGPLRRAAVQQLLTGLTVAAESSDEGYDRELFEHWVDDDRDRCDTREEVLIAESLTPSRFEDPTCRVVAGRWFSLYDGVTVTDPRRIDIDHVVALGEAWRSGAAMWDARRRRSYANDLDEPLALIAVTASTNRSKSDDDPARWRPPDRRAWCPFATAWITVKLKWSLMADPAEIDALREMVREC